MPGLIGTINGSCCISIACPAMMSFANSVVLGVAKANFSFIIVAPIALGVNTPAENDIC
jgi:hypothetical protein